MQAEKIIADWKKKVFKPINWLEGEEPYFIDKVMQYAEHNILSEAEAGFNLTIFYGRDADWANVVNACMRYPMFADKQVVLLKEAQQMRDIDKLENYIMHPSSTTIFVVSYKEKKLDGRGKLSKYIAQNHVLLTTKKLWDNQLPEWISNMVQEQGLTINNKALNLLADHIGNDLQRLENEVEKITLNLHGRKDITEDDIENFVGISKEFNVFELQGALAKKDLAKAVRIIQYFEANPKAAPIQLILPILYSFFSKIYIALGTQEKPSEAIKKLFGSFGNNAKTAMDAAENYNYDDVEKIILLLHQYNLKSVGVNDNGNEDASLLKELVVKMMY